MAHLNWHGTIIRRWQSRKTSVCYHLTNTGWLLKTTGPRFGGTKVAARPKEQEKKDKLFHILSNSDVWVSEIP